MQILLKKNILGGSVLHILQIHNFVIWLQMLLKKPPPKCNVQRRNLLNYFKRKNPHTELEQKLSSVLSSSQIV